MARDALFERWVTEKEALFPLKLILHHPSPKSVTML
jgi:hypothetical protein